MAMVGIALISAIAGPDLAKAQSDGELIRLLRDIARADEQPSEARAVVSRRGRIVFQITINLKTGGLSSDTALPPRCFAYAIHKSYYEDGEARARFTSPDRKQAKCTVVITYFWPEADDAATVRRSISVNARNKDGRERYHSRPLADVPLPPDGTTLTYQVDVDL